ncbi:MAG TPA: hypothetical protein VIV60_03480 [Polyangiaceae bacterium]
MGAKLEAYFLEAEKLAGMRAKIKLAMLTKLSAKTAAEAPDSPQNVAMFEAALATLRKEFA